MSCSSLNQASVHFLLIILFWTTTKFSSSPSIHMATPRNSSFLNYIYIASFHEDDFWYSAKRIWEKVDPSIVHRHECFLQQFIHLHHFGSMSLICIKKSWFSRSKSELFATFFLFSICYHFICFFPRVLLCICSLANNSIIQFMEFYCFIRTITIISYPKRLMLNHSAFSICCNLQHLQTCSIF